MSVKSVSHAVLEVLLPIKFSFQFAVDQPCMFMVDNAQFIDEASWDFLEDLSANSHAVLVLSLRPFSSSNPPCEAAIKLIGHKTTKKIKLGEWICSSNCIANKTPTYPSSFGYFNWVYVCLILHLINNFLLFP